ncbi:MAG: hypothetical protein ACFE9I_18165 [Candidatus Hermodarchaeota archaeon]
MKKKSTISIKDPRLRKVRYELRRLLQLVESAKVHEILDIKEELLKTEGFWDRNHPNFERVHKEIQRLNSQENELSYAFNCSIAWCPVCQSADKDMTYNPVSKEWLCIDCYVSNQKFYASRGQPELYP